MRHCAIAHAALALAVACALPAIASAQSFPTPPPSGFTNDLPGWRTPGCHPGPYQARFDAQPRPRPERTWPPKHEGQSEHRHRRPDDVCRPLHSPSDPNDDTFRAYRHRTDQSQ